jgi:hypothetical protein
LVTSGGKAKIVGSYVGAYRHDRASLVTTGMQAFRVRAVVGLVLLAAVVFRLAIEDSTRMRALLKFYLRPTGAKVSRGTGRRSQQARAVAEAGQTRRYLPRVDRLRSAIICLARLGRHTAWPMMT